jgi:hypothetical protein
MGKNDDDQLGEGWHELERGLLGRWSSQEAVAYCHAPAGSQFLTLEYSYPAQLEQEIQPTLAIGSSTYPLPSSKQAWSRHTIPLESLPETTALPLTFRVRRSWTGEETSGNGDQRALGIAVRSICLTSSEWRGRLQLELATGQKWLSAAQRSLRGLSRRGRRISGRIYQRAHDRLHGNV